jgi:hypothetical protein
VTGNTACVGALNIDSSATSIADWAFQHNHNLTSIVIPGSVITIGSGSFNDTYFNSITFNEGLTSIGWSAFSSSSQNGQTVDVILPNSLTTIGGSAFAQSSFNSFSIGENVTSIGGSAFYNNFGAGPVSVVFRGNSALTTLSDTTFTGYRGDVLDLPQNLVTISNRAIEFTNLEYLIIPNGVTSIGNSAFQYSSSLKTLILSDNLSTIGTNVFTSTTGIQTLIYCGSSASVQNYNYPNSLHPVCAKAVIFRSNGGSGNMVPETGTSTANLTSNTFTKFGSSFVGWNTKADGSGIPYAENASYSFSSNIVLYAQWATVSVPGAPTIGTATTTTSTSASISFTAPASNGGAAIDYYECVSTPTSSTITLNQAGSGTCSFTGLTTGTSYQFKVRAHNSAGFSSYSSLSSSVTPTNTPTPAPTSTPVRDLDAEKREADEKLQKEIDNCKKFLKMALLSNQKVEQGTFIRCGYRPLSNQSESYVVKALQALPIESRTSEAILSAVVTRIGLYEDLQGNKVNLVTPRQLVAAGIMDISTPNKTLILIDLRRLEINSRDSIAEIDAFFAKAALEQVARKERLLNTLAKIQGR